MKIFRGLVLGVALISAGCVMVQSSHVVTGEVRQAVSVNDVKVSSSPPPNAIVIGIVRAVSGYANQKATDKMVLKLRMEAASLGANLVVIGAGTPTESNMTTLTGTAYFVQ